MFLEIDNFLDKQACDEIIERCSKHLNRDKVGIEYNRQGCSLQIEDKDINEKLFKQINLYYTHRLVYDFSLGDSNIGDTGYAFHRYGHGEKLYVHSDGVWNHGENEYFHPRILSLIIHLTDNENADLIFPRHDKSIKTKKGKLVAFLPHHCYEHYMNNNSGKNRDVIVTWLVDKNLKVNKV